MRLLSESWQYQLAFHGIFFVAAIISQFFLKAEIIELVYYLLADLIVIFLFYKQLVKEEDKKSILVSRRSNWLKQLILRTTGRDSRNSLYLDNILNIHNGNAMGQKELGFSIRGNKEIKFSPDMEEAESEVVKMEERASYLIGSVIFLPVLFALIHIFRSVEFPIFLFEMQITFLLAQFVSLSNSNAYQVTGWGEMLDLVEDIRNKIAADGRKAIGSQEFLLNRFVNELGMENIVSKEQHASHVAGMALTTISRLPAALREESIDTFTREIISLPKNEQLLKIRWKAYKTRLLLISSVGVAISALLSSLSRFNFEEFSDYLIPIKSTTYLPVGLGILTIGISLLVTKAWMSQRILLRLLIIWTFVYFLIYSLANALFMA
ncbi:MAG: hypothetical protein GPJ54_18290 [Candidatus Heimdallarchaeota archaeon]|nr:hypothetical protein [Candidatus Heimdallarchaeota archaeon]